MSRKNTILFSKDYQSLNAELHQINPGYGASGKKWIGRIEKIIDEYQPSSILDYGCGKGSLKKELETRFNIPIFEYDPAITGKDNPPSDVDLIICTDVLEHIEPEYLDNVLQHILNISKISFLVIACRKGNKFLPDGQPAHLIIQSPNWWEDKLNEYGSFRCLESVENKHLIGILT